MLLEFFLGFCSSCQKIFSNATPPSESFDFEFVGVNSADYLRQKGNLNLLNELKFSYNCQCTRIIGADWSPAVPNRNQYQRSVPCFAHNLRSLKLSSTRIIQVLNSLRVNGDVYRRHGQGSSEV